MRERVQRAAQAYAELVAAATSQDNGARGGRLQGLLLAGVSNDVHFYIEVFFDDVHP